MVENNFDKPDFQRGDKRFFLGNREVVPLDPKIARKYGFEYPYKENDDTVLGPLALVLTPSVLKRAFDSWVKGGCPPVGRFSESAKRVNSYTHRLHKDAELDENRINELESQVSELTTELNRTKSTLHQKKESVKVLLEKCEKFDAIDEAFGKAVDGYNNSEKSKVEKQADCEVLNELLRESLPNLNKTMVKFAIWRYESLTFWQKIKFVLFGQ